MSAISFTITTETVSFIKNEEKEGIRKDRESKICHFGVSDLMGVKMKKLCARHLPSWLNLAEKSELMMSLADKTDEMRYTQW